MYACGAPIVVESAKNDFVAKCHLPADEFYADAFTSAADLAKKNATAWTLINTKFLINPETDK